jgi:hypothetical protein
MGTCHPVGQSRLSICYLLFAIRYSVASLGRATAILGLLTNHLAVLADACSPIVLLVRKHRRVAGQLDPRDSGR